MRFVLRYTAVMTAALALTALTACEREVDGDIDALPEVVADAGGQHAYIVNPEEISMGVVVGAETRTDFDSYVGKFAWSDGDKIAIHLSDGTFYETEVNAETGLFTCSTTSSKQRDAYAVYPASARDASNYGSPTLNVVLPAEYDISSNLASDYSPVPMIAINSQVEDDLYFRHVGSMLRLTCDRVPVNTCYISVTFDHNVAGSFPVVNPASENPTIGEGGNSATVLFRVASDRLEQRTDGIILNIPIPVATVTTMTVAALDANRNVLKTSERDVPSISRGHGKKLIYNVTPAFPDSMQMIISASEENGMTFKLPFRHGHSDTFPADLRVEWGDGNSSSFWEGTRLDSADEFKHTYAEPGDYTITLTALAESRGGYYLPSFNFQQYADAFRPMLKKMPTPILKVDTVFPYYMFEGCRNLESVCPDLFIKNPQFMSLSYVFRDCTGLHEIDENIFAGNPSATSFDYTFYGSGLTCNIPEGLFAHNPSAATFNYTFAGCNVTGTIPEGLFAHNPRASIFSGTFNSCRQLSGTIPPGLFANNPRATKFDRVFYFCSGLTGSIPSNLFANNPLATTFEYCFSGCSLTGRIPGQLFANHPEVTSFRGTFSGCSSLSGEIPERLFANCPLVTDFGDVFSACRGLRGTIPSELFAHNPLVTDFSGAFSTCFRITGISAGLFAHNPEATSFYWTFLSCGSIRELPADMFAGCSKVTTFDHTFSGCTSLSTIHSGLFADCTEVTTFASTFCDTKISGTIPADLFANNTKVTSFNGTFYSCDTGYAVIPAGLFANNLEAFDFRNTFYQCFCWSLAGDPFCNAVNTPSTRFASVGQQVNFNLCFTQLGANIASAGTAPALWEYTFPDAEELKPITRACFLDANLSNYTSIPEAWR